MFPKISSFAIAILILSNSCLAAGPVAVPLGTAANYAILAETGITNVPTSAVTGNIGLSPAAATLITGFALTISADGTYSTSSQITGRAYAASYASPTPSTLTTAISDLVTAYNNAAGRTSPDHTNLASGAIGGLTLAPGLYKWTSGVSIGSSITISGASTDTWIFQVAGTLTIANGKSVILSGGASPANIVWVVAGAATFGTTSVFKGVVLGAAGITLNTGSTINGRLLAQTAVALQSATVTQP
ncbi:fungal antifreeze protein exerts hyperactivity By constructing an inequable beta-helix [Athelia psychrophila]|uniref:Fungal antifreeze protein exerts hyperactivity By constructing an inequable beta-helix n=1 Tax=Athelia psychrophila TaxID=1759441 RepID=A0A165Z7E8_9AGAM|nr:fungal antifreeze protein exerts hyperactivity By constructing an inequable beta-helix [Fibularhizoctonia sp. CBS 109695]